MDGFNNYGNLLQNYALQYVIKKYADEVDSVWTMPNNFLPQSWWRWSWKEPIKWLINWKGFRDNFKIGRFGIEMARQARMREFADRYIHTMWVHDVTEHDGETFLFKFKKRLMENILYKRFNNIVVSYKEAAKEIKRKLHDEKINVEILKLPQLEKLEFADIKNSNLPIMYDFIFYGRIEKYKGLELLLKVMTDNEMSEVKLLIVGRGCDDKNIIRQVEKLDNVDFINEYVPNRKLAEYIKQSRYVILPYKTATGSQTIQLANYYNKLILATRVGCFSKYIIEGANGFLIDDITYDCLKESMKKIMKIDSNNYTYKIMKEYDSFNLGIISNNLYKIITKNQ